MQSANSQNHGSAEIHFANVHCRMSSTECLLYNVIYKMPAAAASSFRNGISGSFNEAITSVLFNERAGRPAFFR